MTTTHPDPRALLAAAGQVQALQDQLAQAQTAIAATEHALDQALEDLASERSQSETLRSRVARLERAARAAEAQQIEAARAAARPTPTGPGSYPDLRTWVDQWLLRNIERDVAGQQRWCVHWHQHPEALWRLTALWQDYERSWSNPQSGITGFSRNSLAHHLPELLAPGGPFAGCSPEQHEPARRLPQTQRT